MIDRQLDRLIKEKWIKNRKVGILQIDRQIDRRKGRQIEIYDGLIDRWKGGQRNRQINRKIDEKEERQRYL